MKHFCILLSLFALFSFSVEATDASAAYEVSSWAEDDVTQSATWRQAELSGDLRTAISRGSFAEYAGAFVSSAYDSNIEGYLKIVNYRSQRENETSPPLSVYELVKNLGVLKGRENGDLDLSASITRQEAAVMLSRTCKACNGELPDCLYPLTYSDQNDIADWAIEDIQAMTQLGILTGLEDGSFDPEGSYSIEQCLVTLNRLEDICSYDGKGYNPFHIPALIKPYDLVEAELLFAIEANGYYIYAPVSHLYSGGFSTQYIEVIGPDHLLQSYRVPIQSSGSFKGGYDAIPENPQLSEDGTELLYTATIDEDIYVESYSMYYDPENISEYTLQFQAGTYTVSLDLETGVQNYSRTHN